MSTTPKDIVGFLNRYANAAAEPPGDSMTTASTGTAIIVRDPPNVYEPRSLAEARDLAVELAASRMFSAKGKEQALAVMGAGAELGLSPLASLRMIYVADFGQGPQISISADAMVAACLRRRDVCVYFRTVETTDTACTVETQRHGDPPRRLTFTAEDAKRAGLSTKGERSNWGKYPAVMLRHRAASILAREVYPDILGGMYTDDELREAAAASAPAPLTPIGSPTTDTIRDAEFTEVEPDDARLARLTAALRAATSDADAAPVLRELTAAYPDKDHPHRAALRAVYLDRKAAKWAHEPAHDPVTGEVERQPGEDG